MKKTLLLGTTALFAAAVVMGGAAQAAEEPITAGVGGYFRSAIGFISQDNADGEFANGNLSTALANNVEISVSGSTTFDNGITAGFNAQLDPAGMDERHVFFRGSFGQIQVGQLESARQQMTNFAPNGNYNFGVNTPFFIFGNPGNTAFLPFANVRTYDDGLGDEDNLKLIYFSPTFNGFRLGMSYAPDDAVGGAYGGNTTDGLGALQNNASIAAEFSNNFGDFSIRVSAGYETYKLETCNVNAAGVGVVASFVTTLTPARTTQPTIRTTADQNCDDNPDSIQFGGTVSFGEWAIGGGYLETAQIGNTGAGAGRDREDFDLGISYWSGAYGVGLMYGQAELDDAAGLTDQFSLFELNGTYVVGPGVDIGATVRKGEFDDATAGGADNDFTSFAIGAALNF
jgi:hypothetical protein